MNDSRVSELAAIFAGAYIRSLIASAKLAHDDAVFSPETRTFPRRNQVDSGREIVPDRVDDNYREGAR